MVRLSFSFPGAINIVAGSEKGLCLLCRSDPASTITYPAADLC